MNQNNQDIQDTISEVCDEIKEMLIEKNKSYGNSVQDPVNIFSKHNPIDLVNTRIDDKLSRIKRGTGYGDEDTILDLIGYLILRRCLEKIEKENDHGRQ